MEKCFFLLIITTSDGSTVIRPQIRRLY